MRYLLWDTTQIEEGGNGGAVLTKRRRKDGDLRLLRARIADERAGVRIKNIHQEEFFVPVDSNLGAVVGEKRRSSYVNPRRIAQVWVEVRGGMRMFAAYFWHTEGWTPRHEAILEAVLERARATKHSWLVACDADMSPVDFE